MVSGMDMRKLVGSNCARIRAEKELTQEELAARSGFSQTIYEIAQALGVSHLELVAV